MKETQQDLERLQALLDRSLLHWGERIYLRVEAEKTFTFARYPERLTG